MSERKLTPEQRVADRALCGAATKGPWLRGIVGNANVVSYDGDDAHAVANVRSEPDRTFVARAREALPDALDDLDATEADVAKLRAVAEAVATVRRRQPYERAQSASADLNRVDEALHAAGYKVPCGNTSRR